MVEHIKVIRLITCDLFSEYSKEELEAYQCIEHLANLITEKVKFLGEGRDPVSPVQVMAIQIEVKSNLDVSCKGNCENSCL
jgi:hypothetical protein